LFQNPPPQLPAAPLPPAGPALLLRALCKRALPADAVPEVPATVYSWTGFAPAQLARYNALLGFAPGALPLSAYYLPVQRAHLATMLQDRFPFRLAGMVHVENAIVAHRPLVPGTPLRLATRVLVEPPTRSGARFCLLETTAWDGAEPVFDCSAKYLAVAGRKDSARTPAQPLPALPDAGAWLVGRGEGRAYARVSGDWNPIHLAAPAARLFGLRAPIIHGMHSVARALALLEASGERACSVVVRFRAPVPLGAQVRMLRAPDSPGFVLVCGDRVAVEGSLVFANGGC